jgi:hypothetical protein
MTEGDLRSDNESPIAIAQRFSYQRLIRDMSALYTKLLYES